MMSRQGPPSTVHRAGEDEISPRPPTADPPAVGIDHVGRQRSGPDHRRGRRRHHSRAMASSPGSPHAPPGRRCRWGPAGSGRPGTDRRVTRGPPPPRRRTGPAPRRARRARSPASLPHPRTLAGCGGGDALVGFRSIGDPAHGPRPRPAGAQPPVELPAHPLCHAAGAARPGDAAAARPGPRPRSRLPPAPGWASPRDPTRRRRVGQGLRHERCLVDPFCRRVELGGDLQVGWRVGEVRRTVFGAHRQAVGGVAHRSKRATTSGTGSARERRKVRNPSRTKTSTSSWWPRWIPAGQQVDEGQPGHRHRGEEGRGPSGGDHRRWPPGARRLPRRPAWRRRGSRRCPRRPGPAGRPRPDTPPGLGRQGSVAAVVAGGAAGGHRAPPGLGRLEPGWRSARTASTSSNARASRLSSRSRTSTSGQRALGLAPPESLPHLFATRAGPTWRTRLAPRPRPGRGRTTGCDRRPLPAPQPDVRTGPPRHPGRSSGGRLLGRQPSALRSVGAITAEGTAPRKPGRSIDTGWIQSVTPFGPGSHRSTRQFHHVPATPPAVDRHPPRTSGAPSRDASRPARRTHRPHDACVGPRRLDLRFVRSGRRYDHHRRALAGPRHPATLLGRGRPVFGSAHDHVDRVHQRGRDLAPSPPMPDGDHMIEVHAQVGRRRPPDPGTPVHAAQEPARVGPATQPEPARAAPVPPAICRGEPRCRPRYGSNGSQRRRGREGALGGEADRAAALTKSCNRSSSAIQIQPRHPGQLRNPRRRNQRRRDRSVRRRLRSAGTPPVSNTCSMLARAPTVEGRRRAEPSLGR